MFEKLTEDQRLDLKAGAVGLGVIGALTLWALQATHQADKERKLQREIRDDVADCIEDLSNQNGVTPHEQMLEGTQGCEDGRLSQSDIDDLFFELAGEDLVDCLADRLDLFFRTNLPNKVAGVSDGATNAGVAIKTSGAFSAAACLPDRLRPHQEGILRRYAPNIRERLKERGWDLKVLDTLRGNDGSNPLMYYLIWKVFSD